MKKIIMLGIAFAAVLAAAGAEPNASDNAASAYELARQFAVRAQVPLGRSMI